ncbi:CDP-glycerol:glycerophosphate glycerophosphotransferase [Virgibacillus soli]|nr:CDP-glycerol:glycerophosphate glycerophosphotransferase [Virgibacillus soli]
MLLLWRKISRSPCILSIYKTLFQFLGLFPPKKLIIFESFHGKQFSDNPRAIYEYMVEQNFDYEMYWSIDKRYVEQFRHEKNIKCLKRFSLKWLIKMARAQYWIVNSRLPLWVPKPKKTIYVQTWHGTPLKKLGLDIKAVHMPGTTTEKYKQNFTLEATKWDYLVSPNSYSTTIFTRAFNYFNKILETGYPRNDFLINCNPKETFRIKERVGVPLEKKIILYAPTWRDDQFYNKGKYKFDLQLDLEKLRKELGDSYFLILRLHYLVAENLDLSGREDFVKDLSNHEDIRELYVIADMLVTDYSSVFFDYANLKRPMLFYVYDIEEYRDKLRGFYFDFERQAPGPLVKCTNDLINEIKLLEKNGYSLSETTKEFNERFCSLEDGHASERVVNEILQ